MMDFLEGWIVLVMVGMERDESARTMGKNRKKAAIFPVGTIIVNRNRGGEGRGERIDLCCYLRF